MQRTDGADVVAPVRGPASGDAEAPPAGGQVPMRRWSERASLQQVLGRLEVIAARVHAEVARRRAAGGSDLDDRFRGLYVSDQRVEELLASGPTQAIASDAATATQLDQVETAADAAESAGASLRLRTLARAFELEPLDVELLLIGLAPDVDRRFEPLYGYLNDDVSLRRATVGLALQLSGVPVTAAAARERLSPSGPLVAGGIVRLEAADRPLLSRSLRVADRVVDHLLGGDGVDPLVEPLVASTVPLEGGAPELRRAIEAGARLCYLRDLRRTGATAVAAGALAALRRPVLSIDLTRLPPDTDARAVALAATREARLRGGALVAGPIEALIDLGPHAVQAFAAVPGIVVLHGHAGWDPTWSRRVPTVLDAERATDAHHRAAWSAVLGDELPDDVDPVDATALFRLTPEQVIRAAEAARHHAAARGAPIGVDDLRWGARAQNSVGLERLARRIEATASWDDLVVPADISEQLRELSTRWRYRDRVLEDWGMGRGTARGRGVSALFAGGSGTGKTLASEVLANDLGLDLYIVDLSTVIDKYIGETSKNLERIFDEADRVNGVLLFDEADALFGKRSAVSDSKDRHANVEVAYLLQRMEVFDGVAILTTNLASNLDEAFMRRLDAIIDFPSPDAAQRRALWEAKLGPDLPRADDIDTAVLAELFKLSGSEIRNVVVSAAYRAVQDDRAVAMDDLVRAAIREHRKVGRHLPPSELGQYASLLDAGS